MSPDQAPNPQPRPDDLPPALNAQIPGEVPVEATDGTSSIASAEAATALSPVSEPEPELGPVTPDASTSEVATDAITPDSTTIAEPAVSETSVEDPGALLPITQEHPVVDATSSDSAPADPAASTSGAVPEATDHSSRRIQPDSPLMKAHDSLMEAVNKQPSPSEPAVEKAKEAGGLKGLFGRWFGSKK